MYEEQCHALIVVDVTSASPNCLRHHAKDDHNFERAGSRDIDQRERDVIWSRDLSGRLFFPYPSMTYEKTQCNDSMQCQNAVHFLHYLPAPVS